MERKLKKSIGQDLERIKKYMDSEYGFDIFNRSRKREIVDARRIFVALIYSKYRVGLSGVNYGSKRITLDMLSKFMNYDHATVIHLKKTYDSLADTTPEIVEKFNEFSLILPQKFDIKIEELCKKKIEYIEEIRNINFELSKLMEDEEKNEDYYTYSQ